MSDDLTIIFLWLTIGILSVSTGFVPGVVIAAIGVVYRTVLALARR